MLMRYPANMHEPRLDDSKGRIIYNMQWKKVWHLKLNSLQSTVQPWKTRPDSDHMIDKVTCLGANSMPLQGFEQCLIALNDIISYIHTTKAKKDRFIFSSIKE